MNEQTPDAQPSESAHEDRLFNEWTGEVPPTSETTYEELLGHLQIVIRELEMIYDEHQGTLNNALLNPNSILSLAKSAISRAATKYERAKQDELVAELKACRAEVLRVAKEGEKWMMEAERLKSELLCRDITVIPEKDAEFERLEHAKIESEKFITSEFFRVRDINFKLRRALEEIDKYYRIAESSDDFAMEAIQTVRAALTKTPKP